MRDLDALRDRYRPVHDRLRSLQWSSWALVTLRAAEFSELLEYVPDVEATAAKWGLNRLPDDLGVTLIHRWIPLPGAAFGTLHMVKHGPALGSEAGAGRIDVPFIWVADEDEYFEPRSPADTVVLAGPPSGVRERLRVICEEMIDAEVERIAGLYEAAGYLFTDTRSARERHLLWTFRRLIGVSCALIADEDDLRVKSAEDIRTSTEDAVRKATNRIANDMGMSRFPLGNS